MTPQKAEVTTTSQLENEDRMIGLLGSKAVLKIHHQPLNPAIDPTPVEDDVYIGFFEGVWKQPAGHDLKRMYFYVKLRGRDPVWVSNNFTLTVYPE